MVTRTTACLAHTLLSRDGKRRQNCRSASAHESLDESKQEVRRLGEFFFLKKLPAHPLRRPTVDRQPRVFDGLLWVLKTGPRAAWCSAAATFACEPRTRRRHTNTIEGAFGLFKRALVGSFYQVSKKHLDRYLDEFEFRYKNRKNPNSLRDTLMRLVTAKAMPV